MCKMLMLPISPLEFRVCDRKLWDITYMDVKCLGEQGENGGQGGTGDSRRRSWVIPCMTALSPAEHCHTHTHTLRDDWCAGGSLVGKGFWFHGLLGGGIQPPWGTPFSPFKSPPPPHTQTDPSPLLCRPPSFLVIAPFPRSINSTFKAHFRHRISLVPQSSSWMIKDQYKTVFFTFFILQNYLIKKKG